MSDSAPTNFGERLAVELDVARRLLEDLAVELCLDPVVFERHPVPLQRFDQLAQVIGEVACLMRCPELTREAIGAVRLEAMRERLTG